jgi:chaperonin GroEL
VVVKKVKAASTPPQGFDAERNEYVDLMKAGIVDPTKVERIALSIASDDRGADHGHPSEGASHAGHAAPVVA